MYKIAFILVTYKKDRLFGCENMYGTVLNTRYVYYL